MAQLMVSKRGYLQSLAYSACWAVGDDKTEQRANASYCERITCFDAASLSFALPGVQGSSTHTAMWSKILHAEKLLL